MLTSPPPKLSLNRGALVAVVGSGGKTSDGALTVLLEIVQGNELLIDGAGNDLPVLFRQVVEALMDHRTPEFQAVFLKLQACDRDQPNLRGISPFGAKQIDQHMPLGEGVVNFQLITLGIWRDGSRRLAPLQFLRNELIDHLIKKRLILGSGVVK